MYKWLRFYSNAPCTDIINLSFVIVKVVSDYFITWVEVSLGMCGIYEVCKYNTNECYKVDSSLSKNQALIS